jgi:rod shape-determining protein MreB
MNEVISQIVIAVRQALEHTPPELSGDIINRGIALAGGGALVRGLSKRLSEELSMEVTVPADPLGVVAQGAGRCLDCGETFKDVWI